VRWRKTEEVRVSLEGGSIADIMAIRERKNVVKIKVVMAIKLRCMEASSV